MNDDQTTLPQRPLRRGVNYGRAGDPGVKAAHRGVSLRPEEDAMLLELMEYDNPRDPHRSATVGTIIRALYELLIAEKLIEPIDTIAPESYEGWAARWGIKLKA